MTDSKESEFCLDHEHVRVLRDLGSVTQKSARDMIRESIELSVRVKKGTVVTHSGTETMLSPIIFEPPYRRTSEA